MTYKPASEGDLDTLVPLVATSFNMPPETVAPWIRNSGRENWRVLHGQTEIVGALMLIPMGQWFGGSVVSMTGMAGVAVAPSARGRGTGRQLMRAALKELAESGVALSALYGSTTSFYRGVGYERAGGCYRLEVKLRDLGHRAGPLEVRTLSAEEIEAAKKLQQRLVRRDGCLNRGPYLWQRVRAPRGRETTAVGFFNGDRLEGYLFFFASESRRTENELEITDLVLSSQAAQQTFWGYLAAHRAFFSRASWRSPASSPLYLSLSEPWNYRLSLREHWLLRLVNVREALEQRGYPADGELHLELTDGLLPVNAGKRVLTVKDGRGRLEEGGRGEIRLDVSSLAPLYSGFLSATQLSQGGWLRGSEDALKTADSLFRGEPALCDFF